MPEGSELYRKGMAKRRQLMGDAAVEAAAVVRAENPDVVTFVRAEEGIAEFVAQEEALRGREVRVYEAGDENGHRAEADVIVTRIYEHGELTKQARALKEFGIDLARWVGEGEARYRLLSEDGEPVDVPSLREVLVHVRRAGQRGVDVQRYKGLGEMNAAQLWDTTMNPATRTLLRVTLDDAAEADRLFGLLMGESVEPRRHFIEAHALDVKDLDV